MFALCEGDQIPRSVNRSILPTDEILHAQIYTTRAGGGALSAFFLLVATLLPFDLSSSPSDSESHLPLLFIFRALRSALEQSLQPWHEQGPRLARRSVSCSTYWSKYRAKMVTSVANRRLDGLNWAWLGPSFSNLRGNVPFTRRCVTDTHVTQPLLLPYYTHK